MIVFANLGLSLEPDAFHDRLYERLINFGLRFGEEDVSRDIVATLADYPPSPCDAFLPLADIVVVAHKDGVAVDCRFVAGLVGGFL